MAQVGHALQPAVRASVSREARRSAVSAGTWRARRPDATGATHGGPVRAVRSRAARFAVGAPHIVVPSTARRCDAGSPALTVRHVHSTAAVRQRCVARQCLRIRACRAPTLGTHLNRVCRGPPLEQGEHHVQDTGDSDTHQPEEIACGVVPETDGRAPARARGKSRPSAGDYSSTHRCSRSKSGGLGMRMTRSYTT